ncbi:MAG: divalent metal cation transporter, partial [Acidobacteria bacterium]|nr:divalent metal cation transporter [Acidobacteriota bacterium]
EMTARMGVVTGKGLSDLIREEFGLRITFLMMTLLVVVNLTNIMANFAGVAGALQLIHVSRYVSVPLAAAAVWLLILKGSYRSVEKIFLFACLFYVSYIISGILVKPDWKEAAIYSVRPVLLLEAAYIQMLIGMVGTTIAPWMQFYLQAAVVEKGITTKEYASSRVEVVVGCVMTSVIAFFIIVSCAGAIYSVQPQNISSPAEAALGLRPLGIYAFLLFAAGLLNASLFAACVQPLSTAYSVCEGLGFESGVNKRFREAPIFYWLYTLLILVGAGVVLIPGVPLVRMILLSQVINGVLLPFVLIFMILLVNKRDLMGEWVNSRGYNLAAWTTVVVMIGLSLALTGIGLRGA